MAKLIIKSSDRSSIDFAESERVKSSSLGAVVHAGDLNNYAQKDLSNVTYPEIVYNTTQQTFDGLVHAGAGDRVIESYISSDGLTWYRKWTSGWKECGGRVLALGSTVTTVEFPSIHFSTTGYTLLLTPITASSTETVWGARINNMTETSFGMLLTYRTSNNNGYSETNFNWYACGY